MSRYEISYEDNTLIIKERLYGEWVRAEDIPRLAKIYMDGGECRNCGYFDDSFEKCDKWCIYIQRDFFCSDYIKATEALKEKTDEAKS